MLKDVISVPVSCVSRDVEEIKCAVEQVKLLHKDFKKHYYWSEMAEFIALFHMPNLTTFIFNNHAYTTVHLACEQV